MDLANHFELGLIAPGGLFLVTCLLRKTRCHQFRNGGLELDRIYTCRYCSIDKLVGHFQAGVVIDADFCNDEGTVHYFRPQLKRSAGNGRA